MKRPLVISAIFTCVCTAFCYYFLGNIGIICAVVLVLIGGLIFFKRYKYAITVSLCFLAIYSSFSLQNNISKLDGFSGQDMVLDFVAVSDDEVFEKYSVVQVKTITERGIGKGLKLTLYGQWDKPIKSGDRFQANVTIKSLKNQNNKLYYYSNGYYVGGSVLQIKTFLGKDTLYTKIGELRRYINKSIDDNFSHESAGMIKAITLGNKTQMSDELQENIRKSGVSHVVVVSGMHLAIILFGIFGVFNKVFYNRYFKVLVSIGTVFLIAALCGFTMSVLRAGIMFIISALAALFDRDSDPLNSLSLTVIIILIATPFAIFNISFQLSVLATFAIVSVVPFISEFLKRKLKLENKLLCFVSDTTVVTVSATIFTLPVTIYNFGYVSTVAVLTNLLISYAVTLALQLVFFGLIANAVGFLSVLSGLLFYLSDIICKYVIFVINTLGGLKFSYIRCPKYMVIPAVLLILLLLATVEIYDTISLKKALKLKGGEKCNADSL